MKVKKRRATKLSPDQRIQRLIRVLAKDGFDCTVFVTKRERQETTAVSAFTCIQDTSGNSSIHSNLPDLPHVGIMLADAFNINQSTRLLSQLISSHVKSDYLLSSLVLSDKPYVKN